MAGKARLAGWPNRMGGQIGQISWEGRPDWLGGQMAGRPDWLGGQIGWEARLAGRLDGWKVRLAGKPDWPDWPDWLGGPDCAGWPDWLGSQTGLNLILHLVNNSTLSTKRLS